MISMPVPSIKYHVVNYVAHVELSNNDGTHEFMANKASAIEALSKTKMEKAIKIFALKRG